MRRRLRQKTTWVFLLAMLGSLSVHLPVYEVLGKLAKVFEARDARRASSETTMEFDVAEPPEVSPEVDQTPDPESVPLPVLPTPDSTQHPAAPAHPAVTRQRPTPPEPEAPAPEVVPAQPTPEPPQVDTTNPQAVQQRSADPSVAPPPDARFIARENSRVDEETQARLRSLTQDAPQTSAGRPHQNSEEEEPGNADDQQSAEARDREGSDARRPTPEESQEQRPVHASTTPPPNVVAAGDGRAEQRAREAQALARQVSPAVEQEQSVQINDGDGSFTVTLPRVARSAISPLEGGEQARRRQVAGEGRGRGQDGPDLRVAWSQFENIAGRERLDQDREAYLAERRSRQRGSSHEAHWREFRAAMENYVPGVRMGNQTALNAAASPFAEYIAAVHRRIHPQYAERFLAGLPSYSDNPFSDSTLMTKLEIILERDGRVHRIGIIRTSGFLPFDYGAFAAVMRAQPFPEAPTEILSGDGRVYLRWGFYRNERQCGTFNAEPYILPNPPDTATLPGGLRDTPAAGGVIPSGSTPTWGRQHEPSEGAPTEGAPTDGAPSEGHGPAPPPGHEVPTEGTPPHERPAPVAVPAGAALG